METFVLMGKFSGISEVKLRKYEECTSDMTVTDGPRFYLKLDIAQGENYLTQHNAPRLARVTKREGTQSKNT